MRSFAIVRSGAAVFASGLFAGALWLCPAISVAAGPAAAAGARVTISSSVTLVESAQEKFGVVAPFGGPTSSGMLTLHCPPEAVYALTSFLREHGAEAVAVADLDYVFSKDNPLYAKLEAGL